MFKRLFKLFIIPLLLFGGYFAYAKAFSIPKNQYHQKNASFKAAPVKDSSQQLANNCGIPAQIVNLQRHKTVHNVQYASARFNQWVKCTRYLDLICSKYSIELSLFRKLILFPFHAFW